MNLAIRGIDANLGDRADDAFHRDLLPDLRADFILANPPFNKDDWFSEALARRPTLGLRAAAGRQRQLRVGAALLHHLAPNGTAGFVLANGSLSSKQSGEGEIRRKLVEADLVDCIVAMPEKLFFNTGIPVSLWFLPRTGMAMVTATAAARCCSSTPASSAAWRPGRCACSTTPTSAGSRTRTTPGGPGTPEVAYEDMPGFCKAATAEEVAEHDFVLTPGRYVGAADEADDGEPIDEKLARLQGDLIAEFDESRRLEDVIRNRLAELAP